MSVMTMMMMMMLTISIVFWRLLYIVFVCFHLYHMMINKVARNTRTPLLGAPRSRCVEGRFLASSKLLDAAHRQLDVAPYLPTFLTGRQ